MDASPHYLVEFLAAVSRASDVEGAIAIAAEMAAEEFNAEFGVVVLDGEVRATIGFADGEVPPGLAEASRGEFELPGIGRAHVAAARWSEGTRGRLVVLRLHEPFTTGERNLLLGMASGLGLSLRMIGALEAERELRNALETRQRLLESLLGIQRAISERAPLSDVLAAVTREASSLVGDRPVALVLDDPHDPARPIVAARAGHGGPGDAEHTFAAPVHVNGRPAGALVATVTPDAPLDASERELIEAFARHASIALTDARTVEAMEEAYRDPVTGLPNRALFADRLEQALALAARQGGEVAVLFVDLDRFKAVNDSIGHAAGDQLLRLVAERLSRSVRASDTVARFGGDEFAILLHHDRTRVDAPAVAERIIAAMRHPFEIEGRQVSVGATIGIAYAGGGDADPDELLRDADLAMYRGKHHGRGHWAEFDPSMRTALRERVAVESDLQAALAGGQISLAYQPVVDLADGAIAGVEALLRWRHPERGLVPPTVFVPIAEEMGLMDEIGAWVLDRALAQHAIWRAGPAPRLGMGVNVSSAELRSELFAPVVERALAAHGLPGHALILEIAEGALAGDVGHTLDQLTRVKELGVAVAIDDFGTGASSLAHLHQFDVDFLKIDRSFMNALDSAGPLVRSIVDLARTVGLRTVAEGLERGGQVERLRAMGCELGQGFHLGRPVPADEMTALLERCPTRA